MATSPGPAWLPALALLINAFVWGVSWWPLRELQGAGLHPLWATVLIYAVAVGLIHQRYSQYLNFREGTTGHRWQNRYFSCPLDETYRYRVLRYVERMEGQSADNRHTLRSVARRVTGRQIAMLGRPETRPCATAGEGTLNFERLDLVTAAGEPASGLSCFLYRVEGGGHTWPGGEPLPEFITGETSRDINATRLLWEFFQAHPLP